MPTPVYTSENCVPAYQLRWSLSLFSKIDLPPADDWFTHLQSVVEADGIHLLEVKASSPKVWQFLLSTTPNVTPPEIVKSVKGRLQHHLRETHPKTFQRNFSLSSLGDASREVTEAYVADQLGHHRMADERVNELLARFQLSFPDVSLSEATFSAHGRYLTNLHLVLIHDERWRELREDQLVLTRDMILRTAKAKGHRLSRVAILPDHIHLTLGARYDQSPQEVALSYMNNVAYAHGMQARFQFGYYVGTFGEYDMGAVWNSVAASHGSTDQGRRGPENALVGDGV